MSKMVYAVVYAEQMVVHLTGDVLGHEWNIQEEIVNFVIYCLLRYSLSPYNFGLLINRLVELLRTETRVKVRSLTLEAFAVIHNIIGSEMEPHLAVIRHEDQSSFALIRDRLSKTHLPRLHKIHDGIVQYVLLQELQEQRNQRRNRRALQQANFAGALMESHGNMLEHIGGTRLPLSNHSDNVQFEAPLPSRRPQQSDCYAPSLRSFRSYRQNTDDFQRSSKHQPLRSHDIGTANGFDGASKIQPHDNIGYDLDASPDTQRVSYSGEESSDGDGYLGRIPSPTSASTFRPPKMIRSWDSDGKSVLLSDQSVQLSQTGVKRRSSSPRSVSFDSSVSIMSTSVGSELSDEGINDGDSSIASVDKSDLWMQNDGGESLSSSRDNNSMIALSSSVESEESGSDDVDNDDSIPTLSDRGKVRRASVHIGQLDKTEISYMVSALRRRRTRSMPDTVISISSESSDSDGEPFEKQRHIPRSYLHVPRSPSNVSVRSMPTHRVYDREGMLNRERVASAGYGPPSDQVSPSSGGVGMRFKKSGSSQFRYAGAPNRSALDICSHPIEGIPTEMLTPCSDPTEVLDVALRNLEASDWKLQHHALSALRRLIRFHAQQHIIPKLHAITTLLLKFADNLRSSLSRYAIVCLGDMFEILGRSMDPVLEHVVPVLLRKTSKANKFLNDEATSALRSMAAHATEHRVLSSLLNFSDSKTASVRGESAILISECIQRMVSA